MDTRPTHRAPLGLRSTLLPLFLFALVLLGGGTLPWAQAFVFFFVGCFLLYSPPQYSPGKWFDWSCIVFLIVILSAFLPRYWFGQDPLWLQEAVDSYGFSFVNTVSVQPRLSLEAWFFVLLGVSWVYGCLGDGWSYEQRRGMLWGLAIVVSILAVGIIIGNTLNLKYPFAQAAQNFTYFPNRNQTSNILCLGGLISFGLMMEAMRTRHKLALLVSFLLTCISFVSLPYSISRGGILLFFLGVLLWGVLHVRYSLFKNFLKFGIPFVILCFAFFLLLGSDVWRRFIDIFSGALPFRILVFRDALNLSSDNWFAGVGLANFADIFPYYREHSLLFGAIIHPESDWLWLLAETGVVGFLVCLSAVFCALFYAHPFKETQAQPYRIVALVAVLVFLAHSCFDVPAHRLGTFMFAGLLLALSFPSTSIVRCIIPPNVFRGVGALFLIISFFSSWSLFFQKPWVFAATRPLVQSQIKKALEAQDSTQVDAAVALGFSFKPLEWEWYFQRGQAKLLYANNQGAAKEDFRKSRFLAPHDFKIALWEGKLWLPYDSDYAFAVWRDALHRYNFDKADAFKNIYVYASSKPEYTQYLSNFSKLDPAYRFFYLQHLHGEAFTKELADDIRKDPLLAQYSVDQQRQLFSRWLDANDTETFLAYLEEYSKDIPHSWVWSARIYARQSEYEKAARLARMNLEEPKLPDFKEQKRRSFEEIKRSFLMSPTGMVRGTLLFKLQIEKEQWKDALRTAALLAELGPLPPYVLYWKGRIFYSQKSEEQAWNTWVSLLP